MNNQNQAPLKRGVFVERFSGPNCPFVTTGVLLCGTANKAALKQAILFRIEGKRLWGLYIQNTGPETVLHIS